MYEEIRPLQEKQLSILKELIRICEKNKITYYVVFGTLLGTIRHSGFIPWDDDIDICMPWEDYLKFEEVCKKDLNVEFFLQTRDTDPAARLTYDKLRLNSSTLIVDYVADRDMNHGIDIDIYPLYNVADGWAARKIQYAMTALYMLLQVEQPPENHGGLMRMGSRIVLFLLPGKARMKLKKYCHAYMAKYEKKKTRFKAFLCGNMCSATKRYPSEYFEKGIQKTFEDTNVMVPVGYDGYLSSWYGDYMVLPPVEERTAKLEHIVKIDTENPYLSYKGIFYCTKNPDV